ncbi:MAG: Eco57I restriction-modification methylase domain-containing protein [Victivallales bacterium]|nr:Eco57I restriction-modification methylase domain-containing protein [Victivallales bacterium]
MNNTQIKTVKTVYPQIYAYILPEYKPNDGWIKIGYTERKDVNERIRQQTHTAGITPAKLWSEPAKFIGINEWFTDRQLHAFLRKFKHIEQRANTEWFYYNGTPEKSHTDFDDFRKKKRDQVNAAMDYQLRVEQQKAVELTLTYASDHPGGEFLWNAKPRFGKTLTTYDLARQMKARSVLIVTNRPAIANSWFDDFEKFIAWQTKYKFVSTADSLSDRAVITREEFINANSGKSADECYDCITFISLQDLKGAKCFGGAYDKLDYVKELTWDLLVIDEAHEGIETVKTDTAFNNIKRNFTLHLSGTPFKAIASGKFSAEQIYNWTYADEQDAKESYPNDSETNNPYENLPRLNLFSYQMSRMITDEVNQGAEIDGENVDFAFDLNEFFLTDSKGEFVHKNEVKTWLDTLTTNEKYPFSTPALRDELKHTFWYLSRVASAKALEKLLREHPIFGEYEVILAAGDGRSHDSEENENEDQVVMQRAFDRVKSAIKTHPKTITLSVGQLTTGVTVPEWTAVIMLSNLKSPSQYMQAAFRSQNPWSYTVKGEKRRKENAYVFDFAPERTLILYDQFANNLDGVTAEGGGTSEEREQNIGALLNFFPVIAEDEEGKMVELDVRQVLTIPTFIKAQEVVRRGFMSNLLFQNIGGIFASAKAREILEKLKPVKPGKRVPDKIGSPIDTREVNLDDEGNPIIPPAITIGTTKARFGRKIYGDVQEVVAEIIDKTPEEAAGTIKKSFRDRTLPIAKDLASERSVSAAQAEQIVEGGANVLGREVEIIKRQTDIKLHEAETVCERAIAEAGSDQSAIAEAKERFEHERDKINADLQEELAHKIEETTEELTREITKEILVKGEVKKKDSVEDDVRARLRGFSRTIPPFLMAYGTPDTTLANFDTHISEQVFKEVTSITLDEFRVLRDECQFFDSKVFDDSVRKFLSKKEQLADYFDETQTEDIFNSIPPQRTNQIYTPKRVVKMMIDALEKENPGLFTDPDKTFADLYVKSGLFLAEIVKRLYAGLKKSIPDKHKRLKHILENQIYGFAPSEIIYNIAKNFVYGNFADIDNSHLVHRDLTEIAKTGGNLDMKFDAVVGNPPYQEEAAGDNTAGLPIYNFFIDFAYHASDKVCLITPARFLFNAGQTSKSWNDKMLSDPHIKVEHYEQDSKTLFPNTDIKGGVAITYRDTQKDFGSIETFTSFKELKSIMKKAAPHKLSDSLTEIMYIQNKFNLDVLFKEYPQYKKVIGSGGKDRRFRSNSFDKIAVFTESPINADDIKTLGVIDNERVYRYIPQRFVDMKHENIKTYKVLIPKSNGSGAIGEVLSTPLVGEPLVGFTGTFISIGAFDHESEAQNCLKYVKSKFARTMLGILKVTQDNPKDKWAKVPLQDFTAKSDVDWTKSIPEIDRQLYKKYGLEEKEIAFIEEKVRAME